MINGIILLLTTLASPPPLCYSCPQQSLLCRSARRILTKCNMNCASPLLEPHMDLHACTLSCSVMSDSLQPQGLQPTRLHSPWDFPGKNTRMDCHFLLQGIFLTQGSNPGLLRWQADSSPLGHLTNNPDPSRGPLRGAQSGPCCPPPSPTLTHSPPATQASLLFLPRLTRYTLPQGLHTLPPPDDCFAQSFPQWLLIS